MICHNGLWPKTYACKLVPWLCINLGQLFMIKLTHVEECQNVKLSVVEVSGCFWCQTLRQEFPMPDKGVICISGGNGALGLVMGNWLLDKACCGT